MKLPRTAPALLLLALAVMMGSSLGCNALTTLLTPSVPTAVEKPEVPGLKAPDAPSVPGVPDEPESRHCCLRDGSGAAKVCARKERCCAGAASRSACEDAGGYWFNSAAGCAGAC